MGNSSSSLERRARERDKYSHITLRSERPKCESPSFDDLQYHDILMISIITLDSERLMNLLASSSDDSVEKAIKSYFSLQTSSVKSQLLTILQSLNELRSNKPLNLEKFLQYKSISTRMDLTLTSLPDITVLKPHKRQLLENHFNYLQFMVNSPYLEMLKHYGYKYLRFDVDHEDNSTYSNIGSPPKSKKDTRVDSLIDQLIDMKLDIDVNRDVPGTDNRSSNTNTQNMIIDRQDIDHQDAITNHIYRNTDDIPSIRRRTFTNNTESFIGHYVEDMCGDLEGDEVELIPLTDYNESTRLNDRISGYSESTCGDLNEEGVGVGICGVCVVCKHQRDLLINNLHTSTSTSTSTSTINNSHISTGSELCHMAEYQSQTGSSTSLTTTDDDSDSSNSSNILNHPHNIDNGLGISVGRIGSKVRDISTVCIKNNNYPLGWLISSLSLYGLNSSSEIDLCQISEQSFKLNSTKNTSQNSLNQVFGKWLDMLSLLIVSGVDLQGLDGVSTVNEKSVTSMTKAMKRRLSKLTSLMHSPSKLCSDYTVVPQLYRFFEILASTDVTGPNNTD